MAWANDNVVCVVGHNGATGGKEDHKPAEETDPKTKVTRSFCPKYRGLTCDEHQKVQADVQSPPEGFGKITLPNGVPNTWIITPAGEVIEVAGADRMSPKAITEKITAILKAASPKPIPYKTWQAYAKSFTDADKATEDGKVKDAMTLLAKVDADAKKLSKPLAEKWKAKVDALNAKVASKFDEIKIGSLDAAGKAKAVKALRAEAATKLSTGNLPALADLDTWLKDPANGAAPAK